MAVEESKGRRFTFFLLKRKDKNGETGLTFFFPSCCVLFWSCRQNKKSKNFCNNVQENFPQARTQKKFMIIFLLFFLLILARIKRTSTKASLCPLCNTQISVGNIVSPTKNGWSHFDCVEKFQPPVPICQYWSRFGVCIYLKKCLYDHPASALGNHWDCV